MSGQWEVVGKKNTKNTKLNKQAAIKEQQQQKLLNGVKVEEVLPMSQLKNLYGSKGNKENRKPQQEKPAKNEKENKEKSAQKQQAKKPQPDNKVKQFKSIDNAFHSIKAEDLSAVYDKNKVVYPTTPIVWLRELAQFLNTNIVVDTPDVTFSSKPDYYPLCAMPSALQAVLEKGLKQAGAENCALFYDICLTSMANDMNKNQAAIGHKVFIQLLSQQYPALPAGNITKYITLRNSYQNRPNIGMSILWALGQGGLKDLNVGINVFKEIMNPILDMKNYTRDILKYLVTLLKKHSSSSASITKEEYLFLVDLIYSNKKNITSDLYEVMPICNELLISGNGPFKNYVEPLLLKLGQIPNKACKNHLSYVLVKCMHKDSSCLNMWENVYANHLPASASLINYIEHNWRTVSGTVDDKVFKKLLATFAAIDQDFDKGKKTKAEGLLEFESAVKRLSIKMAGHKKKGRSSCSYFKYIALLLIGTFVFIDVKQNGGWSNSCTSNALNKTGVYTYTSKAYDHASDCTVWVHNHIEETFPGITESTIKHSTPYIELGRDLGIIAKNVFNNAKEAAISRVPLLVETIETYAPGLIEKTQEVATNAWSTCVTYFEAGKEYLLTKVFVGKLAPEEIGKTITIYAQLGAEKAQEYYSWLYNKIMTAIK